ncbi:Crp/Fnr family transcriptional regulator [Pseudoalteromonas sp. T1lg65]|uniref:Crp/Fnr family transcriptional regulator n=1 Tax=Pseudoalteromonas sp. T1lg65 TaxID=2077101 RepID=UPI003F7AC505
MEHRINTNQLSKVFRLYTEFSDTELEDAQRLFTFETFEPKQFIFCEGELVKKVYFVIHGIGRYFYVDHEGIERNKSLVKLGGAFTSVSSIVGGAPSPFYTQAITTCTTAAIAYEDLILLTTQYTKWNILVRRLYEKLVLKKEKREADLLLLDAKARYQVFLNDFGEGSELVPLRHIASYLGVTDVTLSRIRKQMDLT